MFMKGFSMLLSKFTPADKPLYELLAFDEQAMGMNYGRVFTEDEAEFLFAAMLDANEKEGPFGYYKVFDGGEFIGMGALAEAEDGGAEIEYVLLPRFWGRGLGTELARALVEMAEEAGAERLAAITDPANERSRRILRGLGFGLVKSYINEDGDPAELYEKSVRREGEI